MKNETKINLLDKISSKYVKKIIFSYLKLPILLKFLKPYKKLRKNLYITDFHYIYYFILIVFKNINIETLNDILNSPYILILPENERYEVIAKLIKKKKLFLDKPITFDIYDKLLKSIIKEKSTTNYLININSNLFDYKIIKKEYYIEEKNIKDNNYLEYINIIKNNIDKIIFNLCFEITINIKIMNNNYIENIKYLNIIQNYNNDSSIIDISNLNTLIYLSVKSIQNLKLIFSKNQYKNIETLKIDYNFEDENKFEKLTELHVNSYNLNKVHFNSSTIKKLILNIKVKDSSPIEPQIKSIFNILLSYISLTHLELYFDREYRYFSYGIKENILLEIFEPKAMIEKSINSMPYL